ncbi:hypothetical protein PROVRETT_09302 [Providencia rettgeri DSM 1131]|nr:hypothetical protein PROVRETT_09302 [Providencia rettgeri DSM 1131]
MLAKGRLLYTVYSSYFKRPHHWLTIIKLFRAGLALVSYL